MHNNKDEVNEMTDQSIWKQHQEDAVQMDIDCTTLAGFNSNVDEVFQLDPTTVQKAMQGITPVSVDLGSIPQVNTVKEFFEVLKECLRHGRSFPKAMDSTLPGNLRRVFGKGKDYPGGQATIIANQLAGFIGDKSCLVSQLMSPKQAEVIDPCVQSPVRTNAGWGWKPVSTTVRTSDPTKVNLVFEYSSGQVYTFGTDTIVTPRANRIILNDTSVQPTMCFATELEEYLPDVGNSVDVAFLAGFHQSQAKGVADDVHTFIRLSEHQLGLLRQKNDNLRVHAEYVEPRGGISNKTIWLPLAKCFHSLGINEKEIRNVLRDFGYDHLADEIDKSENAFTLYKGLEQLQEELGISRIHLHNYGYHLILLAKPYPVEPEVARGSCLLASLAGVIRAESAQVADKKTIAGKKGLPLSYRGMAQLWVFMAEAARAGIAVDADFLETGIFETDKHYLVVIPTHIVPTPIMTVGLGDCLSSIAYAAEVSFWRQKSRIALMNLETASAAEND